MRLHATFLVLAVSVCAACGATSPTSASTSAASSTNLFETTLVPGSSAVQSYSASAATTVEVTLASAFVDASQPLHPSLALAAGVPSGTGCTASTPPVRATPGLTAQLTAPVSSGNFCVSVSDPDGALPAAAIVDVRVVVGSPTSQATSAGAEIWTNKFVATGSASHSFSAYQSGTVAISLDSLSVTDGMVGVGLGIPASGGSGCALSQAIVSGAEAGATIISAQVDPGVYCAKVFYAGSTTGDVTFSLTINHP